MRRRFLSRRVSLFPAGHVVAGERHRVNRLGQLDLHDHHAHAPILTNFSLSVVNDQCPTFSGSTDFSFWLQADIQPPEF